VFGGDGFAWAAYQRAQHAVPLRLIGAMNMKDRAEGRLGTEKWRPTNIARDLYGGSGGGVFGGDGFAWATLQRAQHAVPLRGVATARQVWDVFAMLASCRAVKKVKGAGPSQGTQDESLWDSRDGPGATRTGVARILDLAGAGENHLRG
jgi:hypothetical protein